MASDHEGNMSDGGYLSDGNYLSDGDSLPPRQQRYIRQIREALRGTLHELSNLELELIGERLKSQIGKQRKSLGRLVEGLQNRRSATIPGKVRSEMNQSSNAQRLKLSEVIGDRRRRLSAQLTRVDRQMRRAQKHMRRRFEKVITGGQSESVLDYLQSQRKKPTVVRLIDKSSFVGGVFTLLVSECILLLYPEYFFLWYTIFMSVLLVARWHSYQFKKWTYFMLDFCYFAQLCNYLQFFFPRSCTLFHMNFAYAVGPLCCSVIIWRNSLVFHDVDKVTTLYIHILPSWLVYANRWLIAGTGSRFEELAQCEAFGTAGLFTAFLGYLFWQVLFYVKTEVVDAAFLNSDKDHQTSLRWMALDDSKAVHRLVLWLMRKYQLMGPKERFDPRTHKTKIIFMASQFVFTAITILPTFLVHKYFLVNLAYVIAVFTAGVYNGGEYYIEVFSRRYYTQFEKTATAVRDFNADNPIDKTTAEEEATSEKERSASDVGFREPPPMLSDDEDGEDSGLDDFYDLLEDDASREMLEDQVVSGLLDRVESQNSGNDESPRDSSESQMSLAEEDDAEKDAHGSTASSKNKDV